ncbi:MAG: TonB-dependent receptor [Parvularculaceae bacterium]
MSERGRGGARGVATRLRAASGLGASLAFSVCGAASATDIGPDPDQIVVIGQKSAPAQLDRVLTPVIETPQSISTLSREELVDRGINNLNDALRSIPGVTLGAGETSFQGNNAFLRGFTTRNDQFVDNLRDYGYFFRDTFNDQSIDVYKGPSSVLFGRGSTGGVIHRVSKSPQADSFAALEAQGGLDGTRRATFDGNLGGVAGASSALRLNAVAHRSEVEDRDGGFAKRWALAPSFAFGLGEPTTVTLSYLHQEEDNRPDYGVPWIPGRIANPGVPALVERSNYYGFSNDFFDTNVDVGTARLTHQLNSAVTLRANARLSHNTRRFRYSEAIIPAATPPGTPLETITAPVNLFEGFSTDEFRQVQTDLVAQFTTGAIRHKLIAGVETGFEGSEPVYLTNTNVPAISLTNPVTVAYDSSISQFVRLRADSEAKSFGVFAVDTLEFGKSLSVIAGLRWDRFAADYQSTGFNPDGSVANGTVVDRVDKDLSYRAALVWRPVDDLNLYAAYGVSFNPSGEGIEGFISAGRSVAQANINLDPETAASLEIGAKLSLFDGAGLLTVSAFRIDKDNVRVPDPATPGFNSLGGEQRVDGAELEFQAELSEGWRIRAGYTFLDSKTLTTSPAGPIAGEPLILTPRHQGVASVWRDFGTRFSAGVSGVAMTKRLGQNTPASYLVAPGFVLVDLGASYRLSENLKVRANLTNLFDTLYYEQLHPVHVIPGAGRTFVGSVTLSF